MVSQYEPLADRIAGEEGVDPTLFRSLVQQESGWNPQARSSAGAIGLGQLMPGTARELGVDPQNPEQNLRGAARYLRQQMDRFGVPKLALAAYNAGPGRVSSGGTLPQETQNYVTSVMQRAGMSDTQQPTVDTEAAVNRLPEGMREPYREQFRLQERESGLRRQEAALAGRQQEMLASGEARERQRGAEASAERLRTLEGRIQTLPEFIPSRENATEMATLFSLLAVAGQALGGRGKNGAMGAMASMTGMLNGWRQGRQDLYQRERQNFETNMRQIQQQNRDLVEAFNRSEQIAQRNVEAGVANIRAEAARLNAPMLALAAERGGIEGARTVLKDITNTAGQLAQREAQIREQVARQRQQSEENRFAKRGPIGESIMERQTPEARQRSERLFRSVDIGERQQTELRNAYTALDSSERVARLVAENRDAVNAASAALNRLGVDPIKSALEFFQRSGDANTASQQIDRQLDSAVASGDLAGDLASRAKVISKELFGLALADAQSTGRPTVFLERALSGFYAQNLRPETLLELIKARATEANNRIPHEALRAQTFQNFQQDYSLLATPNVNQFMRQHTQESFATAEEAERALGARNLPAGTRVPIIINGHRAIWSAE